MSKKETCEKNLVRKTAKITIHLKAWKKTANSHKRCQTKGK